MRMGEGPHKPPRLVGSVQVVANFKAVQRFEHDAKG
jgi:hypothetical protein